MLDVMPLDPACLENIWSLIEIRDNAVHLINDDEEIVKYSYGAGCGCLSNYAKVVGQWFDEDLSEHRFMILPLSFEGVGGSALAVQGRRSRQAANLMTYLDRAADAYPLTEGKQYASAIRVETRIVGGRSKDAVQVRLGGGPDAPKVALTEAEMNGRFPHDYANLKKRAKQRIPGLKFNQAFNKAVEVLKADSNHCYIRKLYPWNPNSSVSTTLYSDSAVEALYKALKPQ